jgi:CheY-like chemotaxis protein
MTILYADDDKEDQEVFMEIIQGINPEIIVLPAEDGLKTLEMLADQVAPNIIFLDVNMPFLNGYQTLAEIRKNDRFKETTVIIYSNNVYQQTYEEYASLNALYVRKPNTIREGMETLEPLLKRAR